MTACVMCGHDPEAATARSWEIRVDMPIPGLNDRTVNSGPTRFAYAKKRDAWMWAIRVHAVSNGIAKAAGKRRVVMTRVYSGRERERDADNVTGGGKLVVDALVREKLLIDDNPTYLEIHYKQERGDRSHTRISITEFA